MRDDNPGDLSVRIGFARVFGGGPDQGKLCPSLEITDGTSGKTLTIRVEAAQLAEMLSGSEVRVQAADVTGFNGVKDWGKFHKMARVAIKTEPGDYKVPSGDRAARQIPKVALAIAALEADGFRCDNPSRNNAGQWVIIGRRYDEQP